MTDADETPREARRPEPDRRPADADPDGDDRWLSAVLALLGGWLVVQALLLDVGDARLWNDAVVGGLLAAVGAYNYTRRVADRSGSVAAASLAALLGLWQLSAPFVFGGGGAVGPLPGGVPFRNDVAVGLAALVLGAYSAYEIRGRRREADRAAL